MDPWAAVKATALNDRSKTLYGGAHSADYADALDSLTSLSKDMAAFDAVLDPPPKDDVERDVFSDAVQRRAAAWLHAWATLSVLVARTDAQASRRAALVALDASASHALPLLLETYAQIVARAGTREPLRAYLADSAFIFDLLAYRFPWHPGERPPDISHTHYIPSHVDLAGDPHSPTALQRDLLSVHGVLNFQLDHLHHLELDTTGAAIANQMVLEPLVEWIRALSAQRGLDALVDDVPRLRGRVERMADFLEVRARLAAPGELARLADRIAAAHGAAHELPKDLLTLASAAGQDADERLWHAAIWLRYLVLLSFRGMAIYAIHPPAGNCGFMELVRRLHQPDALDASNSTDAPQGAFLRWDQPPAAGHLDRVLWNAVDAALNTIGQGDHRRQIEDYRRAVALGHAADAALIDAPKPFAAIAERLAPYFGASNEPVMLTTGRLADAFRRTSTSAEQSRTLADLSHLRGRAHADQRSLQAMSLAYKDGRAEALGAAFSSGCSPFALSSWSLHSLPTRTFSELQRTYQDVHTRLSHHADETANAERLRDLVAKRQAHYDALVERVAAARLGRGLADLYARVAHLRAKQTEIQRKAADLEARMAELVRTAAHQTSNARARQLAIASRQADLAAAQVDAIVALSGHLEEIAQQASEQLDDLKAQALDLAGRIRDERNRSDFLKIVHAFVSIAGFVLAPFTGGASLGVSQLVNKGIDLVDKISTIDWHHLGSAVAQFASDVSDLGSAVSLGLGKLGAKDPAILKSAQNVLRGVDTAAGEVNPVLAAIRHKDPASIARLGSAIASGFPLRVDSAGRTSLDTRGGQVALTGELGALVEPLREFLTSGGVIAADAASRAGALADAIGQEGNDLRNALQAAVRKVLLPIGDPQTLHQFGSGAAAKVQAAVTRVVDALETMPEEAVRSFASLLSSGGLPVLTAGQQVVVLCRAAVTQGPDLAARLNRYEKAIEENIGHQVTDDLERVCKEASDRLAAIMNGPDDGKDKKLENFARNGIPQEVDSARQVIQQIHQQLQKAKDQLTDSQDAREIASYDASAADALARRADLDAAHAAMAVQNSTIGESIGHDELVAAGYDVDRADATLRGENIELDLAAAELRRAYVECARLGVDPRDPSDIAIADDSGARLADVLSPQPDPAVQATIVEMASAAVGMLQWFEFLGMPPGGDTERERWYRELLSAAIADAPDTQIAKTVDGNDLQNLASPTLQVGFEHGNTCALSDSDRIRWYATLGRGEQLRWLSRIPRAVRDKVDREHMQLLAFFRLLVSPTSPPTEQARHFFDVRTRGVEPGWLRYANVADSVLVSSATPGTNPGTASLCFLLFPPEHSRPHPGLPIEQRADKAEQSSPAGYWRQVSDSLDEYQEGKDVRDRITQGLEQLGPTLVGIYGEWTGCLLSRDALDQAAQDALRSHLSIRLYLAELTVNRS